MPKTPNMPWKTGQSVKIKTLGAEGVIVEVRERSTYRVRVGSMEMSCAEQDLQALEPKKKMKKSIAERNQETVVPASQSSMKVLYSLDLHGFRVEDALRAIEERVNQAIMAGLDEIQIVHGHGSGKIKQAVHEYLKGLSVVRHFKIDDMNTGMTRVFF